MHAEILINVATAFGVEHTKDNPAPDAKKFCRLEERTNREKAYLSANVWPEEVVPKFKPIVDELYNQMESLSCDLLSACSLYLGKDSDWLVKMTNDGNTIMRIIHYPPLGDEVLREQFVQQPMRISTSSPY